jgi:hypothetical protein
MLEIKNIEKLQKMKLDANALKIEAEIYNASDMGDSYYIQLMNEIDNEYDYDTIILHKTPDKYGKYKIKLLSGPNRMIDDLGIPLSEIKNFNRFVGIIEAIAIMKWHKP